MTRHTTSPAQPTHRRPRRPRAGVSLTDRVRALWHAALSALSRGLPARVRVHWRLLRHTPDAGAETTEVVIGIALAAAAAFTVWRFLGPKLLEVAQSAMSGL